MIDRFAPVVPLSLAEANSMDRYGDIDEDRAPRIEDSGGNYQASCQRCNAGTPKGYPEALGTPDNTLLILQSPTITTIYTDSHCIQRLDSYIVETVAPKR